MTTTVADHDARLAHHLVTGGHLTPDAARAAVAESARTGSPLAARIVRDRSVGQAALAAALAEVGGLRLVPLEHLRPTAEATKLLPAALAHEAGALPLAVSGGRMVVAFALPPAQATLDQLAAASGLTIVAVVAEVDGLWEALATAYPVVDVPAPSAAHVPCTAPVPAAPLVSGPPASPGPLVQHLDQLLGRLLEVGGSDLHLTAGAPPSARVHGTLRPLEEFGVLEGADVERLVYGVLSQKQIAEFEESLELDTAYAIESTSRFRVNVFRQRGAVASVMRVIPFVIPDFDSLGLPPSVRTFADLPRGLVLVTGLTGSGKSTTLASLLDVVNRTKAVHILSCEDPIEFVHRNKKAIVNQREVGQDTLSFAAALKRALREDPDVILVGEMRDLETIHMALTAAETGHLVFGTLHTQSAPQTVDRVVDVFPPEQQGQIRVMLATTLQAVITQQLVPTADMGGRAVAAEVLVATPAVRNLIREAKGHQIPTQMQAGAQFGMVTMDQSLAGLVRAGRISLDVALERAANPADLRQLLGLRAV
ncbi:MAG: PilT/PilU family type 4a pilus ATPase [Acidimicrobiia bacterium]|nr:PilT/PilU family type 4a pilus ATPase [Acidimicrobiia bacterium]